MRKIRILLVLAIWVMIIPYLGFPYSWKDNLTTLTGLGLICLSYMMYKESKKGEKKEEKKSFDNFSENNFKNEGEI